jgi:transketolase
MEENILTMLREKTIRIRTLTIDQIGYLGVGHIGGALSIVEILTLLYYRHMKVDPKNTSMTDRDRLVLSKGHAGPALYSVLADKGFFPVDWLHTLNVGGTRLPSHCDKNRTPGIDMTTGSLGQGLSAAIGMAMGLRMDKNPARIFAVIGDGESNEGQVWEAALCAAHFKLDRLIAFTDFNKMQIDGYSKDIMNLEDIAAKWEAFGWHTQRVDGHNLEALDAAIQVADAESSKPSMIVCDTVKGKGAFFAEDNLGNHNMPFDYETAKEAIARLTAQEVN